MTKLSLRPSNAAQNQYATFAKPDYFADFLRRLNKTASGDRAVLVGMSIDISQPEVQQLLTGLNKAAKRGVNVILLSDAYNFLLSRDKKPGPLWYRSKLPKRLPDKYEQLRQAFDELESNGGQAVFTNKPSRAFTNLFAGRSHMKFAVVNNYAYVGGCNITKTSDIDMMIGWEQPDVADWLSAFAQKVATCPKIIQAIGGNDIDIDIGNSSRLLIDAGKKHQSLIFNEALKLIDRAEERIFLTCQFFPNGITAKKLRDAHSRGVNVEILFNHPGKHLPPLNLLHNLVLKREKNRNPEHFFVNQLPVNSPFLHSKILASEKAIIVGSHNYVSAGVDFGTAEIALISKSKDLNKKVVGSIKHQAKKLGIK